MLIISAKIKGGITKAMLRYATHLPSKVAIDRLQTRFHCCGRVNYQEWFFIPWYNAGQNMDPIISLVADYNNIVIVVRFSYVNRKQLFILGLLTD